MKNIRPNTLKGKEVLSRMKDLMGPINENKENKTSVIELTKIGPDGKSYAIVRENHEYYIKVSDKTSNLVSEDFKYIGGLQNKKDKAYPSYAQAIKHLNLDFISLAEAYGKANHVNAFMNDNLVNEDESCGKLRTATSDIIMSEEEEEEIDGEDFGLTEEEEEIDSMVTGEEIKENFMVNKRFKISEVMDRIDDAISEATNERVDDLLIVLESLSDSEQANLLGRLKKKI